MPYAVPYSGDPRRLTLSAVKGLCHKKGHFRYFFMEVEKVRVNPTTIL